MRVFKTKWLGRFVRRERITDADLLEAIERAERGIVDADLGGGLIKQRVARKGQGRSGGFRLIVAYRTKERAFFIYGFAKNVRENLAEDELRTLLDVAAELLVRDDATLDRALKTDELEEIDHGDEET